MLPKKNHHSIFMYASIYRQNVVSYLPREGLFRKLYLELIKIQDQEELQSWSCMNIKETQICQGLPVQGMFTLALHNLKKQLHFEALFSINT